MHQNAAFCIFLHFRLERAQKGGPELLDCAVVGASGYSGAELVALLAQHPNVRLAAIQADSSAGRDFEALHPERAHLHQGVLEPLEATALLGMDVVFLALPHGESARMAAALHGRVGTVIDLSGDLRSADASSYRQWYGREHPAPELLGKAVYGLPELFGADLPGARLVACAGCYATAVQLAAAPALALGAAASGDVVVHAISGTTGAGRRGEVETSFSEVSENLRAYRVGRHQHAPEMSGGMGRHAGRPVSVTFVPHLAPLRRGIFASVVMRSEGLGASAVLAAYRRAYDGAAFVRVVDPAQRLPQTRDVVGTNFCDLAPVLDPSAGSLVVLAVLDNLMKGAAGQAVQIMNRVLGLPETAGLPRQTQEGVHHDVHFQPLG